MNASDIRIRTNDHIHIFSNRNAMDPCQFVRNEGNTVTDFVVGPVTELRDTRRVGVALRAFS